MSSIWGEKIKLSIFGESHGISIGVVLDGLPSGEKIDMDEIMFQMVRRAPGKDKTTTQRKELDVPEIISGYYKGYTTGTPLTAIIRNNDMHSGDYSDLNNIPRPGHADFTGAIKYNGFNDYRGGGHFSGRLTAPMVFAGAVCKQILSRKGIETAAHIYSIANIADNPFDKVNINDDTLKHLATQKFPVLNKQIEADMRNCIENARLELDSVGGIVECATVGLPAGLGNPIFGGVENKLASILFGIPALKGIEFGDGFSSTTSRGSQNNDPFIIENGNVETLTNHHGGILGGITSSMPLIFRVAFKPTPSIYKKQQTVDIINKKNTELEIQGRHDPCIVIRAVPVVEALTAVCLLDIICGK
jgi:chorismate synthase